MRISMKADYAVRALLDLAQHYGEGLVQSGDIASRQGIPEPYLDQLLTILRKAGFIRSIRGPQGGHALAKPPSGISLGAVITALEGSLAPIDCVDEAGSCARVSACAQREIWQEVAQATQRVLNATTIGELVQRQQQRQGQMYYI